jgi:hypothetical protein
MKALRGWPSQAEILSCMSSRNGPVMNKIRALQIVEDIRSGIEDGQLMSTYKLSRKGLQRVLKRLVNDSLISHEELYQKSDAYRSIADLLAARRSPRLYVPIALKVYRNETGEKGFIRDISENGMRVAGVQAKAGEKVIFDIPMSDINGLNPLRFEALCRWTRLEGKNRKYPVGGFEITSISKEAEVQYSEIRDLVLSRSNGEERRLYSPLNVPELLKSANQMRAETECRDFSGTVDHVDILDFVQFMLLIRKKAVLHIHSLLGHKGKLYLDDGQIVHAIKGEKLGRQAFFECMSFKGGFFSIKRWHEPSERSIDLPGDFLLMEAARMRDDFHVQSADDVSRIDKY